MGSNFKSYSLPSFFLLLSLPAFAYGWGFDGHQIICKIAQDRLSESAAAAVKELLPAYAGDDLSTLCPWADRIKFRYRWSSELHYIDTPDDLCTYNYNNNLTKALLFLSHFMGDIHQPLHVGFTSDRGGNTIDVRWFRRKSVLHSVWDKEIIETAEDRFYDNVMEEFVDTLKQNITGDWSDQVVKWEKCNNNDVTCPDIYASESIKAACNWAYKDVKNNTALEDDYFLSRLPIVNLRLAESAVRLAVTLNRIFK
ncbi:endonuclease 2-like isoform X2 [Zingiber officinale]|uniref:endonuclease 2-like isoform X2 n=1 Tax=Zingiber officinale TaxID=94328 RepID=UPI001C4AD1A0|nr:endonuclease 2-like isoform X2 [Zingiber officinale]